MNAVELTSERQKLLDILVSRDVEFYGDDVQKHFQDVHVDKIYSAVDCALDGNNIVVMRDGAFVKIMIGR